MNTFLETRWEYVTGLQVTIRGILNSKVDGDGRSMVAKSLGHMARETLRMTGTLKFNGKEEHNLSRIDCMPAHRFISAYIIGVG